MKYTPEGRPEQYILMAGIATLASTLVMSACLQVLNEDRPAQVETWLINSSICPNQRTMGRSVLWTESLCSSQISYVEMKCLNAQCPGVY